MGKVGRTPSSACDPLVALFARARPPRSRPLRAIFEIRTWPHSVARRDPPVGRLHQPRWHRPAGRQRHGRGGQGSLRQPMRQVSWSQRRRPRQCATGWWSGYAQESQAPANRRQLLALHHHHLGLCEPGDALQQSRHADPRPGVLGNSLHPVFERDHLRDRRGGRSHLAQSPYAQSRGLRRRHPPRRDSPPEAISQIVRKPARKWAFRPQAGVAGGTACPTHACSRARGLVLVGQAVSPGVSSMMSSLAQVIVELNLFPVGWITYYRFAACRFELQCLDEWIRRKLRCYRLSRRKQRKRGCSAAGFLRRLGVSAIQAGRLAVSGKGPWRLALTRQVNAAMSVEWFSRQGLVSLVVKYDSL